MKRNSMIILYAVIIICTLTGALEAQSTNFASIRASMEKMTDLQFKKLGEALKGKKVRWSGWVEEVKEKFWTDGYEVWIDMDSPDQTFSIQDVQFDVPEDIALKIEKDMRITFEGTVEYIQNVFGSCQIQLVDAKIENIG